MKEPQDKSSTQEVAGKEGRTTQCPWMWSRRWFVVLVTCWEPVPDAAAGTDSSALVARPYLSVKPWPGLCLAGAVTIKVPFEACEASFRKSQATFCHEMSFLHEPLGLFLLSF